MKKSNSIWHSFGYAFQGLWGAIKTERNLKIHMVMMLLVIIFGILLKISYFEWLICILLFGAVISLELINTAIETTVDIVMPEKNEKAKKAKDVSAAAVLVMAITAAVIGIWIFLPKIILLAH